MLQTWRRSSQLFSDFNNFQFAGAMGMVLFVVLLLFMTDSSHYHHRGSVDLPKVIHPVSMPSANREDAMIVSVTRDGKVYFDTEQVRPSDLPRKIADRLKDRSVERKVYVQADMRARWGAVKLALDGVRAAGILRIAFLVFERQPATLHI
jgi:biopolymer transport protein ExbD/biopolymer transport protein TolR